MRSERMHERFEQRIADETGRAREHEKADPMVVLIGTTGLVIVMLAGLLIFRNTGLEPEQVVVTGHSVQNVRSGMTYEQVKQVAGLPSRSDPPNAFEVPKPDAAVLFYRLRPGDRREYKVIMQGNLVSSVTAPPD